MISRKGAKVAKKNLIFLAQLDFVGSIRLREVDGRFSACPGGF